MKKLILPILFAVSLTACGDNAVGSAADDIEETAPKSSYSELVETAAETENETATDIATETTIQTTTEATTRTTTET